MSDYRAPVKDMRFVMDELAGFRELSQLLAERFLLGVGQFACGQSLAEVAGQRFAPIGVPADDPRRRLPQQRLRRGQMLRHLLRLQPAVRHLVERDHRASCAVQKGLICWR